MSVRQRSSSTVMIASLLFGIVLIALVVNGGMCQRYERKMQRQQLMRQYLDSQRAEEQKRFLDSSR